MNVVVLMISCLFLELTAVQDSDEIYKKINENTFEIIVGKEGDEPLYTKVAIKGNHVVLSGKKEQLTFPVPENVKKGALMGFFYIYTKEDGMEKSEVVRRKEKTYDYRCITLYHGEKQYERIMDDDNVPYAFLKGCIFIEEGYFYVVQKIEKGKIHFIDCYGDKFVEEKLTNQKLLKIPLGYKSQY